LLSDESSKQPAAALAIAGAASLVNRSFALDDASDSSVSRRMAASESLNAFLSRCIAASKCPEGALRLSGKPLSQVKDGGEAENEKESGAD
jgi:hypothetical protein